MNYIDSFFESIQHFCSMSRKRVSEQECAEVRWFYSKSKCKPKWTQFEDYDSMALELAYRRQNDIPIDEKAQQVSDNFPNTEYVLLFGNFYRWNPRVDPNKITSIYWKDDDLTIRRGTWFYADSMQPLEPTLAEQIEKHHLEIFRDQIIPDTFSKYKFNKKSLLSALEVESGEVVWRSVIDVSLHSNPKVSCIKPIVARSSRGHPLKRSFTLETEIDVESEFSDLILVIHGVGQKGYENLFAKNTFQIRDAIEKLMQENFPGEKRRPMVLPIEWRSSLVLDGGLTDLATLPCMLGFRSALNSVMMDIMYYQSALYQKEIIDGVIRHLNTAYSEFIESHPNFKGPVSIFAHSLGSVISYDIITKYSDSQSDDDSQSTKESLSFKVKFLFCIGSPLAVYIVMRGEVESFIPSQCERIINIFHPYDPVAYRLEPLFDKRYKLVSPVEIFASHECNKNYGKFEPKAKLGCMMRVCKIWKRKRKSRKVPSNDERFLISSSTLDSPIWHDSNLLNSYDTIPEDKRLPKRLDYALQPHVGELTLSYLALMKSHSDYWTNLDLVGFVLNQLYEKQDNQE